MRASLLSFVCAGGLLAACQSPPVEKDAAVACVGASRITVAEVAREVARLCQTPEGAFAELAAAEPAQLQRMARENLVQRRLLLLAAHEAAAYVGPAAVERTVAQLQAGYSPAAFAATLQRADLTAAEMRRTVQEDLLIEAYLRDHVRARLLPSDLAAAAPEDRERAALRQTLDQRRRTTPVRLCDPICPGRSPCITG